MSPKGCAGAGVEIGMLMGGGIPLIGNLNTNQKVQVPLIENENKH